MSADPDTNANAQSVAPAPSRGVALLLALTGPWGLGQFYLGARARALAWFGACATLALLFGIAPPLLGATFGYGKVFTLFLAAPLLVWSASLVDLFFVPSDALRKQRVRAVAVAWLAGVIGMLALRVLLVGNVIEALKTPSGSMLPTLAPNDHFMVEKLTLHGREPRRGELIVFEHPEQPGVIFAKRVIALPGDQLELRAGLPWLNGWEVPHCALGAVSLPESPSGQAYVEYLDGEAYLIFIDERDDASPAQGPYRVAPGELWVLGDNRNNSADSRSWRQGRGGGVPVGNVRGVALFRWLSFTSSGNIDWPRMGSALSEPQLPDGARALSGALARCLEHRPPRASTVPPPAPPLL